MKLEYKEETKLQTINDVCGTNEKAFESYIQSKNDYLKRRDEQALKRLVESVSWQMGRVA